MTRSPFYKVETKTSIHCQIRNCCTTWKLACVVGTLYCLTKWAVLFIILILHIIWSQIGFMCMWIVFIGHFPYFKNCIPEPPFCLEPLTEPLHPHFYLYVCITLNKKNNHHTLVAKPPPFRRTRHRADASSRCRWSFTWDTPTGSVFFFLHCHATVFQVPTSSPVQLRLRTAIPFLSCRQHSGWREWEKEKDRRDLRPHTVHSRRETRAVCPHQLRRFGRIWWVETWRMKGLLLASCHIVLSLCCCLSANWRFIERKGFARG